MNPQVLSEAREAPAPELVGEPDPPEEALDYTAFFRGRSFNLARVVKPADCLARYHYPFVCGLSDPSLFPIDTWRDCVRDSINELELGSWATDYSSVDDELLVEQLIQRVLAKRGIVARAEQVLVTVGGQQALHLALRLLVSAGETLGVEDPGYPDVINMARIEGIAVERLPIDTGGLVLSEDIERCKCLFVTPSHQFPTTVTMALERKRALLERTRRNRQLVIEDDYEADISFNRTPPPALKSLDRWGNVILCGLALEVARGREAQPQPHPARLLGDRPVPDRRRDRQDRKGAARRKRGVSRVAEPAPERPGTGGPGWRPPGPPGRGAGDAAGRRRACGGPAAGRPLPLIACRGGAEGARHGGEIQGWGAARPGRIGAAVAARKWPAACRREVYV